MDALLKELETWNLTFIMVLATLINLMLKKYFFVSVKKTQIMNVICKLLNVEKDQTTTQRHVLTDVTSVMCCIPSYYNFDVAF